MNHKELITCLANRLQRPQADVEALLQATVQGMTQHFTKNDLIAIQGFGVFEVRKKQDRIFTNPASGKQMIVPPKLSLVFKSGNTYKDKLKNKAHGQES